MSECGGEESEESEGCDGFDHCRLCQRGVVTKREWECRISNDRIAENN